MNAINNEVTNSDRSTTNLMGDALTLISNYLATNQVPHDKLPGLVRDVYAAMAASTVAPLVAEGDSIETSSEALEDAPRKRGRPRKVGADIIALDAPKRGRGRPKKVVSEEDAAPKRGRGRPRKHKLITVESFIAEGMQPACSIEDSIQPTYLVCLFDGLQRTSMKRHVRAKYNMTWSEYKKFFNLPASYPECAPDYSERKRPEALSVGLGHISKAPKLKVIDSEEQVAIAA